MPGIGDNTGTAAAELDKFIDTSMEGTEDSFLDEDDQGFDTDDDTPEESDTEDTDTSPDAEPELPLEQQQQRQQPAIDPQNPNGYTRVGHLFADKAGNIVNSQGRVIAAKGEAARHWVNMSKQAGQAQNLQRQLQIQQAEVQRHGDLIARARDVAEMPRKLGISPEDYNEGVALLARWGKDPVGVAREVVSRTLAMGHNVTDILGNSAGNALEMGAIRQLVNEATRGQRQQEQMSAAEQQRNQQSRQQYEQFVMRYPDAETHGDAIANLMNNHQLSAVEAYHEVRHFAQRYGLDFSQPLAPQIQSARAQQPNGNGQRSPQTQRAPMVNGASGGRSQMTTETEYADPNTDWSSILNSVLRDSQ
jgi:predicted amino acid-binding ACT domain protein